MYSQTPFNQDQFTVCYRAYTSALLAIQSESGKSSHNSPSDDTRLTVARRIIEASANGERNALRLTQIGLQGSMERQ